MVASNKGSSVGEIKILTAPSLGMDADSILADFTHYFGRTFGRRTITPGHAFLYRALVMSVRDRLTDRWNETALMAEQADGRQAHPVILNQGDIGAIEGNIRWMGRLLS